MLAILSTINYSATDPIILEIADDSQVKDAAPRISRTATLDGGCLITNNGFAEADRTLQLQANNCSKQTASDLWDLARQSAAVILSVGSEVLQGYISNYRERGTAITVTFLVESKLSA